MSKPPKEVPFSQVVRVATSQKAPKYVGATNDPCRRNAEHQSSKYPDSQMLYARVNSKQGAENFLLSRGTGLYNKDMESNMRNEPGYVYAMTQYQRK